MGLRCFLVLVPPFPKIVATRNINAFLALDSDEDRHSEDPLHLRCWCFAPDLRIFEFWVFPPWLKFHEEDQVGFALVLGVSIVLGFDFGCISLSTMKKRKNSIFLHFLFGAVASFSGGDDDACSRALAHVSGLSGPVPLKLIGVTHLENYNQQLALCAIPWVQLDFGAFIT
ncbi:hypothetical protein U1Q18_014690 [Sarracenia purpurea var. burkii]